MWSMTCASRTTCDGVCVGGEKGGGESVDGRREMECYCDEREDVNVRGKYECEGAQEEMEM